MSDKLILPSGEDAADVTRAIARDQRDDLDAERGTNRNLDLLRQRTFRVSKTPRGVVGYPRRVLNL